MSKFARIAVSIITAALFPAAGSRFASPEAHSVIQASEDLSQVVSGSLPAYHGHL